VRHAITGEPRWQNRVPAAPTLWWSDGSGIGSVSFAEVWDVLWTYDGEPHWGTIGEVMSRPSMMSHIGEQ
jgi:hypothetical protein